MKNDSAVKLGELSAEKRGLNKMTPDQRKEYMRQVRARKTPKIL